MSATTIDSAAVDSIAPVARTITRVIRNPIAKWIGGGLLSIAVVSVTTGIWPFFRGWLLTRASEARVGKLEARVAKLELSHVIDWHRMQAAGSDYLKLTHGEQVYWAVQHEQLSRERLVEAFRMVVALEAEARAGGSGSALREARRSQRAAALKAYNEFIVQQVPPELAASKALASLGGR